LKYPCPKTTAVVNTTAGIGRAKYEPEQGAVVWRFYKYF
jgi:hypothetical protein